MTICQLQTLAPDILERCLNDLLQNDIALDEEKKILKTILHGNTEVGNHIKTFTFIFSSRSVEKVCRTQQF